LFRPVRREFLIRIGLALVACLAAYASLAPANAASTAPAPRKDPERPVLLVLGDSLSAEYGLPRGAGWVRLLSDRLQQNGSDYTVANASISGETTSGGRTRLPSLLKQHRPRIVILQLGANDGLRGLPIPVMQENLAAMIKASQDSGASVVLVGIRIPPNYGRDYSERFFASFPALAKQHKVALAPFLLDGFADSLELFQPDRIHPTAQAQPKMLENVWPAVRPLLARSGKL
jgi:acyl-CoA thioesterase-1